MIALLNGIVISLWRRSFGESKITGLLSNRTFQALLFVIFQTAFWCLKDSNFNWFTVMVAVWVYAMYWSRAIGCILDYGEAWWQKGKSYGRWWTKPLCWIIKKCSYEKYGKVYDFWWTECRYTFCLLPLIELGHHIWVAGLFSAPIYYKNRWLFKKFPKLYDWFDDSKDFSEYEFGFVSGVLFYVLW